MTVSEIVNLAQGELGTRNSLTSTEILRLLNQIQSMAFDSDKPAFMVSDQFVTVTTGSKGPYSFPLTPPCRRFVGVSGYSQAIIMGVAPAVQYIDYGLEVSSLPIDGRSMYEPTIIDIFGKTFTFVNTPTDVANTYRMVYYRRAPTIRSLTDDANLLIPSEYHHTLCVQGIALLADFSIYGTKAGREMMQQTVLQPFWDSLDGATNSNHLDLLSDGAIGL